MGALSLPYLVGLLFTAAVLGDTVNYAAGAVVASVRLRRARVDAARHTQATGLAPRRSRTTATSSRRSTWTRQRRSSPSMAPRRCACVPLDRVWAARALSRSAADRAGALHPHRAHVRAFRGWRRQHGLLHLRILQRGAYRAPCCCGKAGNDEGNDVLTIRCDDRLAPRCGRFRSAALATSSAACRSCRRTLASLCWPSSPFQCCLLSTRSSRRAATAERRRETTKRSLSGCSTLRVCYDDKEARRASKTTACPSSVWPASTPASRKTPAWASPSPPQTHQPTGTTRAWWTCGSTRQ